MLTKLFTYSLLGIEARPVEVEVDISPGAMPKTILVGLAEAAVKESTHRIERAIVNSGYTRPLDRIVINLSPADLPKEAASFDLPIALGLLAASSQLEMELFTSYAAVGELALDGTIRPVKGALSMALSAREAGMRGILVPLANAHEAAVVDGVDVIAVDSLTEAVGFLSEQLPIAPMEFSWDSAVQEHGKYPVDYVDVKGQESAKRAVTVAAAGSHHLLMIGSPGTGKTLLAQRIGSIMPSLSQSESLETTRIYSAVGGLDNGKSLMLLRPFRPPHHTISEPKRSKCAAEFGATFGEGIDSVGSSPFRADEERLVVCPPTRSRPRTTRYGFTSADHHKSTRTPIFSSSSRTVDGVRSTQLE